jgi:hypothetical protein
MKEFDTTNNACGTILKCPGPGELSAVNVSVVV